VTFIDQEASMTKTDMTDDTRLQLVYSILNADTTRTIRDALLRKEKEWLPVCDVCAECGDGVGDNCEEDECSSEYCDFLDNTFPWPNSCTPKEDVCWTK